MLSYEEQKTQLITNWLVDEFGWDASSQSVSVITQTLLLLLKKLGYQCISITDLETVLAYILNKKWVANATIDGGRVNMLEILSRINGLSIAIVEHAVTAYNACVAAHQNYIEQNLVNGMFGMLNNRNRCCSNHTTSTNVTDCDVDATLMETLLYEILDNYFTTTNSIENCKLYNSAPETGPDVGGGIDFQTETPTQTTISDVDFSTNTDLFDTGIIDITNTWRQRISTYTVTSIGTTRVNAALHALDPKYVSVGNIIDIILAPTKGELISASIDDPSAPPYVEGTSKKITKGDKFVVMSGRFDPTVTGSGAKPYRYIVIEITEVHMTSDDDNDYYDMKIWRY